MSEPHVDIWLITAASPLLTFLPWHKLSDNLVKSLIFYYTFITRCLRNSVIWVRGEIILKGAEQNGWGPRCQAWQSKKELNEMRRHIKCFCHWWIPFPWQLQQDGIYFIWGVMVLVGGWEGCVFRWDHRPMAVSKYKQNLQPTVNLSVFFFRTFNESPCPLHGSQSDY